MAMGVADYKAPGFSIDSWNTLDLSGGDPCPAIVNTHNFTMNLPSGKPNAFPLEISMFGDGLVATPDGSPGWIHSPGDLNGKLSVGYNYLDYGIITQDKSHWLDVAAIQKWETQPHGATIVSTG